MKSRRDEVTGDFSIGMKILSEDYALRQAFFALA
jgi:hypothetical protein